MSGNDTSCSSVWREAREGSPSGWASPPRAACSPRPEAERLLLIVQEQRGIIKHPPPPPSTSNCCSAGIQTHPESRWSSGPASTSLRARGRTLRRCIVGRPHLFKRLLLNHQFKTLLLLSGGAGGEGMVIEASFCPPRQLGMVRIWCFNRLKVKQNTGRAGQDQST